MLYGVFIRRGSHIYGSVEDFERTRMQQVPLFACKLKRSTIGRKPSTCRNVEIDVVGNCNRLRTTKPECSVDEHERRWGAGKGKRGKVGIEYRGHGRPLVDGEYIKLS